MPRESQTARLARVQQLIALLERTYPEVHSELTHSSPLELLIATVLSAQCTDKQVNVVTRDLFATYRTASDYAATTQERLEADLRRLGFFRTKARHVRSLCQALMDRHGGNVPQSMEQLTALDGVGRKTANVVLGNAFNIQAGVVVDTHVARLSQRLGLVLFSDPARIEIELIRLVPQPCWTLFSHWLIWHGRRRCRARNPDCAGCELAAICPRRGVKP